MGRRLALGGALVRALVVYWFVVFPQARREVRRWRRRAASIEDPLLRGLALGKLSSEALVAEGAAAFALLAARTYRAVVVRAVVAYEILYDLVDAIGELPSRDPLAHNRAVHAALLDALTPGVTPRHRLPFPGTARQSRYLSRLVHECREALLRLPGHRLALPALARFATRACEAQSLNHAGALDDHRTLALWATTQRVPDGLWWEVAAAAGDPLGVFALIAAAGDPATEAADVAAIERAYFPWIGALVWLMESLVDQDDDARSGNHSYIGHYDGAQHAADRLMLIASRAGRAAWALPRGPTHSVLLAGVASLYLSDPRAAGHASSDGALAIRKTLGWPVATLLVVLRMRRAL